MFLKNLFGMRIDPKGKEISVIAGCRRACKANRHTKIALFSSHTHGLGTFDKLLITDGWRSLTEIHSHPESCGAALMSTTSKKNSCLKAFVLLNFHLSAGKTFHITQ